MTITDIVTKEGIDADFMHWLWNIDRKTYTLILLGHIELITDDLIEQYAKERQKVAKDCQSFSEYFSYL